MNKLSTIDKIIELSWIHEDNDNTTQKSNNKQGGLNPANHNTETKRYAKLSLSLTNDEKQQIQEYKNKHYPRTSISSMILLLLEKEGVFDENSN